MVQRISTGGGRIIEKDLEISGMSFGLVRCYMRLWMSTTMMDFLHQYDQGRINHWANRANARGLALEYQNTRLLVFHIFRLFTTRQNCRVFWILRLVYRSRKLITLAFIVFEWPKRIEPNRTALYHPRIRSKSVHPWTSAEIFPGWGNVRIFLILYRLLTMPCKWTFTKRFTLSTTLVCAGWTSILNRLSKMFSTLRLSEMITFS